MNTLETGLAIARGLHLASALAAWGLPAFAILVLKEPDGPSRAALIGTLRRWTRGAALAALAAGLLWFATQAAVFVGDGSAAAILGAAGPTVATRYGHVLVPRLALLAGAVAFSGRLPIRALAAVLGLSLALHAGVGHVAVSFDAASLPGLVAEVLHLLAAGAWLGGMVGLLLATRHPTLAATLAVRFSPLGVTCVTLLAATALLNGVGLIGSLAGLLGTTYGHLAIAKAVLFALMLACAALNRWRVAPGLARGAVSLGALRFSVLVELTLGAMVVALAAWLASIVPGAHDQPLWPFARKLSGEILSDPDYGGMAWRALGFTTLGIMSLIGVAFPPGKGAWRRLSWKRRALEAVFAAGFLWWGVPDLDLLTVQAFPTSFWSSPTGFTAASVAQGAALFPGHCARCHGSGGAGDGPDAAKLSIPPADLTAHHLLDHSEGDIFWWLTHGMPDPDGKPVMPAFASQLTEDDRWALIDYIHTLNSGTTVAEAKGVWTWGMPAPELDLNCPVGPLARAGSLADLAGHPLLLAIGYGEMPTGALAAIQATPVVPVMVSTNPDQAPPATACGSSTPEAAVAYHTIGGAADGPLLVLVDSRGALRRVWQGPFPATPEAVADLAAQAADAERHPFASGGGGHHHH
ncbi:CopD family protein [Nitrospirillum iridis]|uniref:Putative copper export protein/mono/diheme cytochrome c family protein n=1 Tax=Nitrospirillum iridis TaxID=765888 RepID=A0A7X0B101_9PROT|nr:CopD family protein [Nitrospirillum iridis]MBB6253763.1 putative copper export protein/mono/diheme cytochrome c family protein [Nitrospirillum iridis]